MSENESDADADAQSESEDVSVESLSERLDAIAEDLETAETEADLDDVESDLDAVASDLEDADLPEPEDDDEEDPAAELESRVSDLRDDLEDARGPYADEVVENIEEAKSTVADTRWTETGEPEVVDAVEAFLATDELDVDATVADIDDAGDALDDAIDAVEALALDPDEDAATIEALLEASKTLLSALDEAEEWDDLSVREQLDFHGFYDVLDHRKDYPPEWHAIKVFEREMQADKILIGLDMFESDFMQEHCMESLERLGPEEAIEPMMNLAQRRDKQAISVLGKIGSEEPVEMLLDYVDADSDPALQKVTFKALGEIGSEEAVQPLANKLAVENEIIRSRAARALGLIGDTRAVEPLADVLEDDEDDTVRASAAWALNQIGTERALDAVAAYGDDRSFLVQDEAEKAAVVEDEPETAA
ncbi:HEAT repeat domain-containing protein [Haloarchaeobius sp. HME9146]|uniref:HEAT repeat domain-containing protein n=1 Tax=Haloarchaeobius sp. HME9146 TaxID=2978732 RepID=UPI0021C21A3F|nr:HEAT repeat domain-containing protein [Haloarchaeobius sp. HME9146]MCT9096384.1 HEAT repeat domain-containing protein [Haloarchaeobius sp. HME9146]